MIHELLLRMRIDFYFILTNQLINQMKSDLFLKMCMRESEFVCESRLKTDCMLCILKI